MDVCVCVKACVDKRGFTCDCERVVLGRGWERNLWSQSLSFWTFHFLQALFARPEDV